MLSRSELLKRLEVPKEGKLSVILDTDAYNEIDDQFAICYMLANTDRFDIKGICAAPFFNERSSSPKDGEEKSYRELERILDVTGKSELLNNIYHGSHSFLQDSKTPVESDAANFIVKTANEMPENQLLYVVAIGAITNVASAILTDPSIVDKIVVVWLGGHDIHWPDNREFNCFQDTKSAAVVFDCGVPLIQAPCMGVISHFSTTEPELRKELKGKNEICDYLYETSMFWKEEHHCTDYFSKVYWDVVPVAYLRNPDFCGTKIISSPIITDRHVYGFDDRRHPIKYIYWLNRDEIFHDLFTKMQNF
ncbi:MAG: nucleoside hydrolase [Clostridia bacterium]|nr:nucleoside hydrolase [Clostridia bacterium]